jgi:hypothetical protein
LDPDESERRVGRNRAALGTSLEVVGGIRTGCLADPSDRRSAAHRHQFLDNAKEHG